MVFGDGDGEIFNRFTIALDVIGHELTHGVTEDEAAIEYSGQSGALNESLSDVAGSQVKQYQLGQLAARCRLADRRRAADGRRQRRRAALDEGARAPPTTIPRLGGKDPQPAHMDGYVDTTDDNGGVHINSGIPNHAFYLAATALGGHSWEKAGRDLVRGAARSAHHRHDAVRRLRPDDGAGRGAALRIRRRGGRRRRAGMVGGRPGHLS